MARIFGFSAIAIALLLGGAFLYVSQKDVVFRFSESDLRERVDDHLPWQKRYLFIFEITIDHPRIDLVDGSDRVAGGVDLLLNIDFGNGEVPLAGAVDVIGGVEYEAENGEFFLVAPEIENIDIQGVPNRFSNQANAAISLALTEFYRTRPIYSLDDTDVSHLAAKLMLKDVVVKDEHLVVTLGRKKD